MGYGRPMTRGLETPLALSFKGVVALGCLALVNALPSPCQAQDDEGSKPKASPEVQAQVGMGTEKEEPRQPPTRSKEQPPEGLDEAPAAKEEDFGHGFQFGLRSSFNAGYKVLFRFDDSPPCIIDGSDTQAGEEEKQVCGYATPPSVDLALSYALFDAIEPYVWVRLGLGEHPETFTEATRLVGVGMRVYTMSDSKLKLFFEPGLALELEGATTDAPLGRNYDTDYVVHGHFGLQYDFLEHLGLYASLGPNVSFVRAIATELEASVGIQGRAP